MNIFQKLSWLLFFFLLISITLISNLILWLILSILVFYFIRFASEVQQVEDDSRPLSLFLLKCEENYQKWIDLIIKNLVTTKTTREKQNETEEVRVHEEN